MRASLATLLAAVAALALLDGRDGALEHSPARPAAAFASGSLSISDSLAGRAIFTASNLAPGDAATGTVTIANAGTLAGRFALTQSNLGDAPGANGGLLSGHLHLVVSDVTRPENPVTVYAGKLADMGPRALGQLAPGEARTYRLSVALPDGGPPPSTRGGDNAFAGSSASVRYVWTAVGEPAAAGDRRPPRLRLRVPRVQRVQRVLRNGYLIAYARCDEDCRVTASSSVHVGPRRWRSPPSVRNRRVGAGAPARLRIKLARTPLRAMRRAQRRGRPARLRFKLSARDRAGNATARHWTIRLRGRKRASAQLTARPRASSARPAPARSASRGAGSWRQ